MAKAIAPIIYISIKDSSACSDFGQADIGRFHSNYSVAVSR